MFKGELGDLLRKAQEMGETLKAKQAEMAAKRIPVSVGGGMVKIEFNGKGEALSISIDKAVVDPNDLGMLQDLVLSAVNQGVHEAQRIQQEEMAKLAGGLRIPGLSP